MIEETTCLITDVQLPGQSGLELQETLRSRGYQMPVILVTAYPNDKDRTRALNNGAVDFLNKPFDEKWLVECLTDAIKLHHKRPTRQKDCVDWSMEVIHKSVSSEKKKPPNVD